MFKPIPKATREEILSKIKNGEKVMDVASQYGVSHKTIYTWLRNQVTPQASVIELNRLKRENEELKRIIGLVTLELERGKKNRHY
jgi:transposase-like protein